MILRSSDDVPCQLLGRNLADTNHKSAGLVAQDCETTMSLSVSDIDRVILLIIEFLPACGAAVSPGEGVTDALATKQVATLGGDHEPSALNDLEKIKKINSGEKHSFSESKATSGTNIRPHQSFTKRCKCCVSH